MTNSAFKRSERLESGSAKDDKRKKIQTVKRPMETYGQTDNWFLTSSQPQRSEKYEKTKKMEKDISSKNNCDILGLRTGLRIDDFT